MKAIRIYPIRVDGSGDIEECPATQADEYAVYAVCEHQMHLADFADQRRALHLAETLSTLLGVPLEDAHNLKGI